MDVFWFNLDLVPVVIFIEIRFLIPKLVNQLHKENCKKSLLALNLIKFNSIQLISHVQLFATPWIAACQASLSITSSRSSLRLTCIESVMPSSHLILCRPLLLLPPIPPASESFPMSQLFAWGGQSTGVPIKLPCGKVYRTVWLGTGCETNEMLAHN